VSYSLVPLSKKKGNTDAEAVLQAVPQHTTQPNFLRKAKKNLRDPFSTRAEDQDNLPPVIAPLTFHESS
jgi:tartrate dehydratase alpha subunit/fumarate hydratase class I-like protein